MRHASSPIDFLSTRDFPSSNEKSQAVEPRIRRTDRWRNGMNSDPFHLFDAKTPIVVPVSSNGEMGKSKKGCSISDRLLKKENFDRDSFTQPNLTGTGNPHDEKSYESELERKFRNLISEMEAQLKKQWENWTSSHQNQLARNMKAIRHTVFPKIDRIDHLLKELREETALAQQQQQNVVTELFSTISPISSDFLLKTKESLTRSIEKKRNKMSTNESNFQKFLSELKLPFIVFISVVAICNPYVKQLVNQYCLRCSEANPVIQTIMIGLIVANLFYVIHLLTSRNHKNPEPVEESKNKNTGISFPEKTSSTYLSNGQSPGNGGDSISHFSNLSDPSRGNAMTAAAAAAAGGPPPPPPLLPPAPHRQDFSSSAMNFPTPMTMPLSNQSFQTPTQQLVPPQRPPIFPSSSSS